MTPSFSTQLQKAMAFVLILLSFSLVACQPAPEVPTAEKDNISVQLGWIHEYSSAGVYAAEKNGHFSAQNLNVTLVEGGFNEAGFIDPIAQVLDGQADFGVSDGVSMLLARESGKPVIAISTILQLSPLAVISLSEDSILRPQDLVGKTVTVSDGGARAVFDTFILSQNIDPTSVNVIPRTSFGIEPLINGEVDALVGWVINEGVQIREAGFEPNFILPSDYGINTYDTVLFTTETTIQEKPELVERFLRALFQGLEDVVSNPDQAIDYTLQYNPSLVREEQLRRLQASLPLIKPAGSQPGVMKGEVWEATYAIVFDQGILSAPLDINTVYTLAFLEQIYGK
ncbi:MAG: ABC transporter substrate-binding protein [Anaerolineales bacterium]